MFNIKQSAKYLGVSTSVIYNRYHGGDLPGKKVKGVIMFNRETLDNFKSDPPRTLSQIERVEEAIKQSGIENITAFIRRGRFVYLVQDGEYIINLDRPPSKMTIEGMVKCIKSKVIKERLYSADEAGKMLGVTARKVVLLKYEGRIKGETFAVVGGAKRLKLTKAQIDDYVNSPPPQRNPVGRPPGKVTNE